MSRSRSTAVVVAVLCWAQHLGVGEALAMVGCTTTPPHQVREQRAMAEPNPGFMEQLEALERRGAFNAL